MALSKPESETVKDFVAEKYHKLCEKLHQKGTEEMEVDVFYRVMTEEDKGKVLREGIIKGKKAYGFDGGDKNMCPINGILDGVYFSVGKDGKLPQKSPYGTERVIIPIDQLLTSNHHLFFAWQCNVFGDNYYPCLVLVDESQEKALNFCYANLHELDMTKNPILCLKHKTGLPRMLTESGDAYDMRPLAAALTGKPKHTCTVVQFKDNKMLDVGIFIVGDIQLTKWDTVVDKGRGSPAKDGGMTLTQKLAETRHQPVALVTVLKKTIKKQQANPAEQTIEQRWEANATVWLDTTQQRHTDLATIWLQTQQQESTNLTTIWFKTLQQEWKVLINQRLESLHQQRRELTTKWLKALPQQLEEWTEWLETLKREGADKGRTDRWLQTLREKWSKQDDAWLQSTQQRWDDRKKVWLETFPKERRDLALHWLEKMQQQEEKHEHETLKTQQQEEKQEPDHEPEWLNTQQQQRVELVAVWLKNLNQQEAALATVWVETLKQQQEELKAAWHDGDEMPVATCDEVDKGKQGNPSTSAPLKDETPPQQTSTDEEVNEDLSKDMNAMTLKAGSSGTPSRPKANTSTTVTAEVVAAAGPVPATIPITVAPATPGKQTPAKAKASRQLHVVPKGEGNKTEHKTQIQQPEYLCHNCGQDFHSQIGLWSHKNSKKCLQQNTASS